MLVVKGINGEAINDKECPVFSDNKKLDIASIILSTFFSCIIDNKERLALF